MGEYFPEGTSTSDPGIAPEVDHEALDAGRTSDEDEAGAEPERDADQAGDVDEEPESQQTG